MAGPCTRLGLWKVRYVALVTAVRWNAKSGPYLGQNLTSPILMWTQHSKTLDPIPGFV